MIFNTFRFGDIEIDERLLIRFPAGLLGFPEQKDYAILEHGKGSPFYWLQSLDAPDLAFVMTNPFLIKEDYLEKLPDEEKSLLCGSEHDEIVVFVLVTVPRGKAGQSTVNLMSPLVISTKSKTGNQVILLNSGYSHCHPLIAK